MTAVLVRKISLNSAGAYPIKKQIYKNVQDANIYFPIKPITFKGSGTLYVDDSLKIYKKGHTNPTVFKKLFEEKLANIQPNINLYTDGSFGNNSNINHMQLLSKKKPF